MRKRIQYNSDYEKSRWVGFFDLLGIKSLITNKDTVSVFVSYSRAIEQVRGRREAFEDVECAWFSDSFLIYTNDDSMQSFNSINHICRWFFYFYITEEKPVRGAISCGSFYADRENDLFFGKALIEAFEYAEAQDWIGFILSPSAENQLKSLGHSPETLFDYAYTTIPLNKRVSELVHNLPACILGQWVGPDNPCVVSLKRMRDQVVDKNIIQKYENAINFIESNQRVLTLDFER